MLPPASDVLEAAGRGVIGVGVLDGAFPTGQGFDAIKGIENRDGYHTFNSALAPTKKFPTAVKEVHVGVPVVVRLEGTNVEKGREMLAASGLKVVAATGLTDAASKVVKLAGAA